MRRLLHLSACICDGPSSKVVPHTADGPDKAAALVTDSAFVAQQTRLAGAEPKGFTQQCPATTTATSHDVFHIDGDSPRAAATACITPCASGAPDNPGSALRVLCRLVGAGKSNTAAQPGPSISIPLPCDTCWATSGHTRRKQAAGGWHAHVLAADQAALPAWGVQSQAALAQAIAALAAQDAAFCNMLSSVAFSVASPMGASSTSSAHRAEYTPSGPHMQPGWVRLTASTSFIRDSDDGCLQPALALTLELRGQTPPHIPLPPIPGVEPGGSAAGASRAAALALAGASNGGSGKLACRVQRKLLRAGAALSSSPYISTFLDLELPPASAPLALDASLAPAPHADGPFAAAAEGAAWSASCMAGGQHGALLGRVLLQNEGSLSYWGKLTSRNKTGSWQLLVELLQDTPNALDDLLQHLREHRGTAVADPAAAAGPCGLPPDGLPSGLMAGAPWKRVVSVPSHNRLFAKVLADQVAPLQKPPTSKESAQPLSPWLGGSSLAAGSVGLGPGLGPGFGPPLRPIQARPPLPPGFGAMSGGGEAAAFGGSPVTPPSRSSPSQRNASASQLQPLPRSPIRDDSSLMSVTPSRQVMSMMAAVANGTQKQSSLNQRRVTRNTSFNGGTSTGPSSARATATERNGSGTGSASAGAGASAGAMFSPVRMRPNGGGSEQPMRLSLDNDYARTSAPARSSTGPGQPEPSFTGFMAASGSGGGGGRMHSGGGGGGGAGWGGRMQSGGGGGGGGGGVPGSADASVLLGRGEDGTWAGLYTGEGGDSDSEFDDSAQDLDAIQEEEDEFDEMLRYHEVQVIPIIDPVTNKEAVLLIQTDITSRALMEQRIAALTESQLRMLEGMFPRHVLEFVMGPSASFEQLGSLAYQHEQVTILFMDVAGFTSMSKEVAPDKVMEFLNLLFSKFDNDLDTYDCYKVETAGDCYIVAGALMTYDDEGFVTLDTAPDGRRGAKNVLSFAQAMLRHARTVTMPHNGQPTQVRIGIHTGSVTSGLIGTKLPKFGLFGDTMNTSSRMESTGRPGCVQISEAMYGMLGHEDQAMFEPSGGIEVKGKGLMPTFIWTPTAEELRPRPDELPHRSTSSEPPASYHSLTAEHSERSSYAPTELPRESGGAPSGGYAVHSPSALSAHGLVGRAKSSMVHPSGGSGASKGRRAHWNLVRNVVRVVAPVEPPESKARLVRSRLSRIATGAKSSPLLNFDIMSPPPPDLGSWGSSGAPGTGRVVRVSGSSDRGGRGGSAPHSPVPVKVVSKQSSMMLMKEMMQLMKATMDD